MAYIKNIVSFIVKKIDTNNYNYNIYNYSDKPDLTMNELVRVIENESKVKIIDIKIPYLFGLLVGYFLIFLRLLLNKFSLSSVRAEHCLLLNLILIKHY